MARPLRKKYAGAKYHVTARGNARAKIFFNSRDYERFLEQLEYALQCDEVILYAYALMPNHYHLLVETPRANIDRFEQRLNTAYSLYYRYKHEQPGHVLQGRYGGKLVHGDQYLLALTRYIHLNPVKTRAMRRRPLEERVTHLNAYTWSSYRGYVSSNGEREWIDYRWRELAGGRSAAEHRRRYRRYAERCTAEDDEALAEALQRSPYAVGEEEFVCEVEKELLARRCGTHADRDLIWPDETGIEIQQVAKAVAHACGLDIEKLHEHGSKSGRAKWIASELSCRLTGSSQRSVGKFFGGVSCAAVNYHRKCLRAAMKKDPKLAELVQRVEIDIRGNL